MNATGTLRGTDDTRHAIYMYCGILLTWQTLQLIRNVFSFTFLVFV